VEEREWSGVEEREWSEVEEGRGAMWRTQRLSRQRHAGKQARIQAARGRNGAEVG